jgi:diguanylate cyclase (GGDEF)-like protein
MTSVVRGQTSAERDRESGLRDEDSAVRDVLGRARDRTAERRNREVERAAEAGKRDVKRTGVERPASRATESRTRARRDRGRSAAAREAAAREREASRAELESAQFDDLTGAYRRVAGAVVLRHEIERASWSGTELVLARVEIDGLGELNDHEERAAGDAVLRDAAAALRSALRPFDPIVRWSADEFVCAISGQSLEEVDRRLGEAREALRQTAPGVSILTGLAMAPERGSSLEALMERAGGALLRARRAD